MKTISGNIMIRRSLTVLFFLVLPLIIFTQVSNQKEKAEKTLEILFDLSEDKNYNSASEHIAYTGSDQERYLKDMYDAKNSNELKQVKRLCKKINALQSISDSYTLGTFNEEKDNEVPTYILNVTFKSGGQNLTSQFKFIQIKDEFVLSELK